MIDVHFPLGAVGPELPRGGVSRRSPGLDVD
jgi:hypothetical protein